MADQAVPKAETYVYILYRDDGTPFYVGIGTGKRWLIHERDAHRGNSRKDRIIQKMRATGIADIPKRKIAQGLTRVQAAEIEVALIASIGRAPHGPLVNHTQGGDGAADLSAEAQAKKAARNRVTWADPEVNKKRRDGMRAVWTAEKRAAHAAKLAAQRADPAYRQMMSEVLLKAHQDPINKAKRKQHTPERRAAQSELSKAMWRDPDIRASRIAKATGRKASEETKAKMRASRANPDKEAKRVAAIKKNWEDDAYRTTMTAALKERMNRPEVREKIAAASRGRKHSPESIAKMSATALKNGNWIGRKHSAESRARMSATRKSKARQGSICFSIAHDAGVPPSE